MRKFWNWLGNKIIEANNSLQLEKDNEPLKSKSGMIWYDTSLSKAPQKFGNATISIGAAHTDANLNDQQQFHFSVLPGTGGFVLKRSTYDPRTDRQADTLHIIPESEDLASSIGNIVAMEMIRG